MDALSTTYVNRRGHGKEKVKFLAGSRAPQSLPTGAPCSQGRARHSVRAAIWMKLGHRKLIRRTWHTTIRSVNRSCVRVCWRAPDDLGAALTAFDRALRAHRRLAKLAPRFFDTAVIDREAENRAGQRRWMAAWAPALARA